MLAAPVALAARGRLRARSASRASCRGAPFAATTTSSTAPTPSRSTPTPCGRASGCSSSTTSSPPAGRPRPPAGCVEAARRRGRRACRSWSSWPSSTDGRDLVGHHVTQRCLTYRGATMATVTRVLPWRRNAAPPTEEVAPLVATYRPRHPRANAGADHPAPTRCRSRPTPSQVRTLGRGVHHPPAGGGRHRRRPRSRRHHDRRRPAARRRRGHRADPRRRRGPASARRSPRSSTASRSSSASSSSPRRPSRPRRCARCSWRWPRTSAS